MSVDIARGRNVVRICICVCVWGGGVICVPYHEARFLRHHMLSRRERCMCMCMQNFFVAWPYADAKAEQCEREV